MYSNFLVNFWASEDENFSPSLSNTFKPYKYYAHIADLSIKEIDAIVKEVIKTIKEKPQCTFLNITVSCISIPNNPSTGKCSNYIVDTVTHFLSDGYIYIYINTTGEKTNSYLSSKILTEYKSLSGKDLYSVSIKKNKSIVIDDKKVMILDELVDCTGGLENEN